MSTSKHEKRDALSPIYRTFRKEYCELCKRPSATRKYYDADGYLIGTIKSKTADLTVHHIDGNIENNDPINLQTLCRECHDDIHNTTQKKFKNRLSIWRNGQRRYLS